MFLGRFLQKVCCIGDLSVDFTDTSVSVAIYDYTQKFRLCELLPSMRMHRRLILRVLHRGLLGQLLRHPGNREFRIR